MNRLTKQQMIELNQLTVISDEEIDTTDIPEQTNWDNAFVGRFCSIAQQENINIDIDILEWFKQKNNQYYQ